MRENASGFDFTSDWLRKWREKLFTQSQKRLANLKRGKTRVTKLRFFYPKVNTSKQPEVRENVILHLIDSESGARGRMPNSRATFGRTILFPG